MRDSKHKNADGGKRALRDRIPIVRPDLVFSALIPLLAALLLCLDAAAAALNGVQYIDTVSGWRAGPNSEPPLRLKGSRGGVGFRVPPATTAKRAYWEKAVELDLSRKELLELEFFASGAEHISEISLHFRSGKGWYSASKPLGSPAAGVLQFERDDFRPDGSPGDWSRIDTVRISIWRKDAVGEAGMHLYRLMASNPLVLIVKDGARGRPDPLSETCAAEIGQWLFDIDIPARTLYAAQLEAGALAGRAMVFLPYNPSLGQREIGMLKDFIGKGGRLFVFYSDKPELAQAMGFKLGAHTRGEEFFPWEWMEFQGAAGESFPARLHQRATAINPASPARRGAEVLAKWKSRNPGAPAPAALLASPQGFWMTQIPRKFDAFARRQMLAAALARALPELAPRITRRMIELAGQINSYPDAAAASLALRRSAETRPLPKAIAALQRADAGFRRAQAAALAGQHEAALAAAIGLRQDLETAYALLEAPAADGALRGVWDHHGVGLYPGEWRKTCRLLAGAGVNAIFPNMLNGGWAHYKSAVLGPTRTYSQLGDQLEQCIAAAREYGMQVHVWKVCWKIEGAPSGFFKRMEREGRLQIDRDGKVLPWLNPAHPANRQMALDSIAELVRNYDIDGVHLDYIRYGWNSDCCSPYSRRVFEASLGRATDWPKDILAGGRYEAEYERWKVEQISSFVALAYRSVKSIDKDVQLSAAVFGAYPDCVASVAQDWRSWLAAGTVDFLAPMNYTDSIDFLGELLDTQAAMPSGRQRIFPGIGVSSTQSALAPASVIEQIKLIRAKGFPGYLFFDLDAEFEDRIMPLLGPAAR
jgi:uncharacterized lipoprotein YddW (UPF0748 family)